MCYVSRKFAKQIHEQLTCEVFCKTTIALLNCVDDLKTTVLGILRKCNVLKRPRQKNNGLSFVNNATIKCLSRNLGKVIPFSQLFSRFSVSIQIIRQ